MKVLAASWLFIFAAYTFGQTTVSILPQGPIVVKVGGTAGFVASPHGTPPISYQWMRDGAILPGATNQFFALAVVDSTSRGSYSVKVANSTGEASSNSVVLTVGSPSETTIVNATFRADLSLAATAPNSAEIVDPVTDLAPMTDGSVIITLEKGRILKLLADGRIDPAFGPASVDTKVPQLLLQRDGRILVRSDQKKGIFRLNADGLIDNTFSPPAGLTARQLLLQPDDKILALVDPGRIVRLQPNGAFDPSFTQADGKSPGGGIALTGAGAIYWGAPREGLRRLLSNGDVDLSFRSPLVASAANPSIGDARFNVYRGANDRIFIDYATWAGLATIGGSLDLLPDGSTRTRAQPLLTAPAPDGTLLFSESDGWGAYDAAAEARLPINLGVVPLVERHANLPRFSADNTLWVGGAFRFYNGVSSPGVVRLNKVSAEVNQKPSFVTVGGLRSIGVFVQYGETAVLRVACVSDAPVTYNWEFEGSELWRPSVMQTNGPNLTITPANVGSGNLVVRAQNSAGFDTFYISVYVTYAPLAVDWQPTRVSAMSDRDTILKVVVKGGVQLARAEWRKNGQLVSPELLRSLQIGGVDVSVAQLELPPGIANAAGDYTVTFSTIDGQTLTSHPIHVTFDDASRITNFSLRASVRDGDQAPIAGFVVPPFAQKWLIARGVGPGLAALGVASAIKDPVLELYDGTGSLVNSNDNWTDEFFYQFRAIGAFSLPSPSADSAMRVAPSAAMYAPVGANTLKLHGKGGDDGIGLIEVYEADRFSERLSNFSGRAFVGPTSPAIAGFVIQGPVSKRVLVRVVGPTLSTFGISGTLADPQLELYDEDRKVVVANDNWQQQPGSDQLLITSNSIGAFALPAASKDAAVVATLRPGNYTVVASGSASQEGVCLIEIFDLD